MRYVRLGKTDLEVSAIAFGTWSFGGDWGSFDAEQAKKTVGRALELGITFFDTAQAYGFGASERLLADALWSERRLTCFQARWRSILTLPLRKLTRNDATWAFACCRTASCLQSAQV